MKDPDRLLLLILRVTAIVMLLALVAVIMPWSWMDRVHRWLGLGPLPNDPIVDYLARSLSAFYALTGGLLWLVSRDVRRHRAVLLYLAGTGVVFGLWVLLLDLHLGLPLLWVVGEGPFAVLLSLVLLFLARRIRP